MGDTSEGAWVRAARRAAQRRSEADLSGMGRARRRLDGRAKEWLAAAVGVAIVASLAAVLGPVDGPDDRAQAVAPGSTSKPGPGAPTSTAAPAPGVAPAPSVATPPGVVAPTVVPPPASPGAPTAAPVPVGEEAATAPAVVAPPVASAAPAPAGTRFAPVPGGGGRFTYAPYGDLGAWLDVYDWSLTFTGGRPGAGLADLDRMAAFGVQTLYIQASKWDSPTDVLEPERLRPIIERSHALGMDVVGWYLPTLVDPAADLRRLLAIATFGVDGLAVDIEARNVGDVAERNRRLVGLSQALRQALPGEVLSAVVLEPVLIEDVNPNFWPAFPWAEIGGLYDVWQPMAYWSNRRFSSGYRDGYTYTAANIDRVRANIGRPDAVVHPIGGIGDGVSAAEIDAMALAAAERRAIGGSIYDYRTTHDALWAPLLAFNT